MEVFVSLAVKLNYVNSCAFEFYVAKLFQILFSLPLFRMRHRAIQIYVNASLLGLYIGVIDNVFGGGVIAEIY